MKQISFICVVGLLAYIWPAQAGSEMVWLKDVTTGFETDKRTFGDYDLPNELTFHLKRGLDTLTLNLKRNYQINPNADFYFAHRFDDGRINLVKTPTLETRDVAYYQDIANGAYMTIRCVKRANDLCSKVINGNIRIGDGMYDLRPAEGEVTSRRFLDVPGHHEQPSVNKKKTDQELTSRVGRLHLQHKQNQFLDSEAIFPNRRRADSTRQLKKYYYVEVAVLIDSELWDSYSWTFSDLNPGEKVKKVKEKIREAYSHILNGVNLLYKELEDNSISINVSLCSFIFLQEGVIQRTYSNVTKVNRTKYIDALSYLKDLFYWDKNVGVNHLPVFDQAILFTDLNLYKDTISNNAVRGISFRGRICEMGGRTSVVESSHYVQTVFSAAHELGHSLGAWHDGEGTAIACDPEDYFIMNPFSETTGQSRSYSMNNWLFSKCSLDSFKNTLKNKDCVTNKGMIYSLPDWMKHMRKPPALVYTQNEQCRLINGPHFVYCGWCMKGRCDERYSNELGN